MWERANKVLEIQNPTTIDDFIDVDNNVAVYGCLTDLDIVDNIMSKNNYSDDETGDENIEEFIKENVSPADARNAIRKLKIFFERCEDVNNDTFANLISVENDISLQVQKNQKQLKIDDFFKKLNFFCEKYLKKHLTCS